MIQKSALFDQKLLYLKVKIYYLSNMLNKKESVKFFHNLGCYRGVLSNVKTVYLPDD